MKALSLHQPWASLVAARAKRLETRGWGTSYRGELAIQAGKRWDRQQRALALSTPFREALAQHLGCEPGQLLHRLDELPRGSVVAVAVLVNVVRTDHLGVPEPERSFGDFSPGRFAWVLEAIYPVAPAVPCRGYQGLFDLDPATEAAVRERLGTA